MWWVSSKNQNKQKQRMVVFKLIKYSGKFFVFQDALVNMSIALFVRNL